MPKYCVAYGCKERQKTGNGIQFHRFPFSRPQTLMKWVQAIRREDWNPTAYSTLCSKHFTDDSYQTRPGAPVKLLKEDAVPSLFNFTERLQKKTCVRQRLNRKKLPGNLIKIESVTSLKDFGDKSVNPASETLSNNEGSNPAGISVHEKRKQIKVVGNESPSTAKAVQIKIESVTTFADKSVNSGSEQLSNNEESEPPPKKSARISVRGKRKPTKEVGSESSSTAKAVQVSKSKEEILEICPKEVRVILKRLETPSTEQHEIGPLLKRRKRPESSPAISTRQSAVKSQRKRLKTDRNEAKQTSRGDDSHELQTEEGNETGLGFCAVCRKFTNQGTSLTSLTDTSKEPFHEKLTRLIAGERGLSVREDEVLCPVCTRLVNYMDRTEVELSMLKKGILNCMRKRHFKGQTEHYNTDQSGSGGKGTESSVSTPKVKQVEEESKAGINIGGNDVENGCADDQDDVDHDYSNDNEPEENDRYNEYNNHDHSYFAEPRLEIQMSQPPTPKQPDLLSSKEATVEKKADSIPATKKLMKTGPTEARFKCNLCAFKTSFRSVFIFHLHQHMKSNRRCDFCNETMPQKKEKNVSTAKPHPPRHKKVFLLVPVVMTSPPPDSSLADEGAEQSRACATSVTKDESAVSVTKDESVVSVTEDVPAISETERTPSISGLEDTSVVSVTEDVPSISETEKTLSISRLEDTSAVSVTEDAAAISETERTPSISGLEDASVVSVTEDVRSISETESTPFVSVAEDTSAVSETESTSSISVTERTPCVSVKEECVPHEPL